MHIPVVDCHCDTLLKINSEEIDFFKPTNSHVDLPKLEAGGVMLQFMAIFIQSIYKPGSTLKKSLELINTYHNLLKNERFLGVKTKEDLQALIATENDSIGLLLSLEGAEPIESIELLEVFCMLGVRCIGLTWNHRNMLADGVGETSSRGGLTDYGGLIIKRMNQLGILIDVAHLSEKGFWDVLDISTKPILVSHANCHTICPHRRNLKDEQIQALAANKGIIAITFYPEFIGLNKDLESITEHILHVCSLVGAEHVAIGSDFDGGTFTIEQLEDASKYQNLVAMLTKKGMKQKEIKQIMGYNVLKLLLQTLPGDNNVS